MSKDSKFVEYWVPVGFSGIQLEQYCANLLCSYTSLSNPSKTDCVGSLHGVLDNARKCCDHPYVVDDSLQKSLVTVADEKVILEVGINASGKLKLLDLMLSNIKSKGWRVLVLFQSEVGTFNIGSIVDDAIRLRFGNDCYERCRGTLQPSKRLASVNKFNTNEGSFIFLLEVQSCTSKIKLCNIDCVILYGSDWNPLNDMKSLQKIILDSKAEKVPVFRLFSPFTVEEKALLTSRNDFSLDNKVKNDNVSANHMLLMWGSSILYDKLADFHASSKSESTLFGKFQAENIVQEFSAIIDQNGKGFHLNESSAIVKAERLDYYVTGSKLPGEKQVMLKDDEPPHIFWKGLLNGKQPQWRYNFSFTSEKKRKRNQSLAPDPSIGNEGDEAPPAKKYFETNESQDKSPSPPIVNNSEKETASENLYELQKNLHDRCKSEIFKLCEVFKFPENEKCMVDRFLDYVMANHRMTDKSATIVEAFQISLCWTVAFFTEFDLNHKRSLSLAKRNLNYSCEKADTEDIFLILKCLKRVFLSHMQDSPAELSGVHSELKQKDLSDAIQDIKQKFSKKLSKLSKKKINDKIKIQSNYNSDKQKLSIKKEAEECLIKVTSKDEMNSLLKEAVEETYRNTFWKLEREMLDRLKQMEDTHRAAVDKLHYRKDNLIKGLEIWTKTGLLSVAMQRDGDSFTPTEKDASKLQPDAPNVNPKAEIFISGIDIMLGPPTAEISQHKDMNSAAETSEKRRVPNEPKGHAQNNMDVDVKPRRELSSELTANCNHPNIGSSQVANLIPENTVIEEPTLASTDTRNPLNLTFPQRGLAISPESAYVRVTNEGMPSLSASCAVEPRKEPISANTCNDNPLNWSSPRSVPPTVQANRCVNEPGKAPTSANTMNNNSLSNLRSSQGIDATLPDSTRAKDTSKSVPPFPSSCCVVEPREEPTSATNTNAYAPCLRSSQASDAIPPEATRVAFKPIKPSQQAGNYSESVGGVNEVLPNCEVAMCENDAIQEPHNAPVIDALSEVIARTETNNQTVVPSSFTDPIETNSPKDIPVDNETNDISANDRPSVRDASTQRPIGTNTNPNVYTLDPFFDGISFPSAQVNEEHVHRPLNAAFDLPARLGISANNPQTHNSQTQRKPNVSPLQIELENILKEKEKVIKTNEDNKMRLRAECEEELMKIRRKYETMLTDAELQTLAKRKELNFNYEKVKLSMLIAEAFKAKTSRSRPPPRTPAPRSDEAEARPRGVPPILPRGYHPPSSVLQRSNSNLRFYGKNVGNSEAVQSEEVGEIVCVSDDD